jgi:hypothetical protein
MLRHESVGPDTQPYFEHFDSIKLVKWSSLFDYLKFCRMEDGYELFVKILTVIFPHHQWLAIVTAIFMMYSIGRFINRNTKSGDIAILCYFCLGLYTFMLTGIRQAMAMSICLFAFEYLKEKKLLKFTLIVILAAQFHTSAYFFLMSYFLANRKLTDGRIINNIMAPIIAVILMPFLFDFVEKILGYQGVMENIDNGRVFFVIILLITILSTAFYPKILKIYPKYNYFFHLNYICMTLWTMRLFSRYVERVSMYFLFFTLIVVEDFILSLEDKKTRDLIYFILYILLIALFIYRLRFSTTKIIPYSFFWAKK